MLFLSYDVRAVDLYSNNGTVDLPAMRNFNVRTDPECPGDHDPQPMLEPPPDNVEDEDAEDDDDYYVVTLDKFASADDLGQEYNDQLSGWWKELYEG